MTWPAEVVALVEHAEFDAVWTRSISPAVARRLDRQSCRIVDRLTELGVEVNHPETLRAMLTGAVVLLEALEHKGRQVAEPVEFTINGFVAAVADCLPVEARP